MADASLTQAEPTRSSRWGEVRDWVEITTPYLDRHNDFLQIYTKRQDCGSILTDDGYRLAGWEQSGCTIDSPRRQNC